MADLRQLPDHRLAARTLKMQQAEAVMSFLIPLGMACFIFSMFASLPLAALGCCVATAGMIGTFKCRQKRIACEEEKDRRKHLHLAAEDGKKISPLPRPSSPTFNSAAATVLERDMRPMNALRLKKRLREFMHD